MRVGLDYEVYGIWEHYEIIDSLGFDVTLSNPVKTRRWQKQRLKQIDPEVLAC